MKLNRYLVKSTVVAALGGLLFGFDTAVISGTTSTLSQTYQLSPALLGITVASAVWGPMYIAEIAPAKARGRLVGFFQFNVVLGILLAYLSNYLIGRMDLAAAEWRWEL